LSFFEPCLQQAGAEQKNRRTEEQKNFEPQK
jgi:hypothetical protein